MTADRSIVRVWLAGPDTRWQPTESLLALLPPDERIEAEQCAGPEIRAGFVRRRALRRAVLAELVRATPAGLVMRTEPGGKPGLVDGPSFSASSSGHYIAFAVRADGLPVGLDVQRHQHIAGLLGVADRFLPAAAHARLATLPERQRATEFVREWVRHEAATKLTGQGIRPHRPHRRRPRPDLDRLHLRMIDTPPELAGAVCGTGPFAVRVASVPDRIGSVRLLSSD